MSNTTDDTHKARRLDRYLANLGYGSRKQVAAAIRVGHIFKDDRVCDDPAAQIVPASDHEQLTYDGAPLDPPPPLHIALNKPAGYVCSGVDDGGPSIYQLLPERYCVRKPALSIAGRLDKDATGLVVLTQDGQWAHELMQGRHAKIYEVTLENKVRDDAPDILASGTVTLKGDDTPLKPVECDITGERAVRLTLYEGRYHQIKRMFAALGNRVTALHRLKLGGIELGDLDKGEYRLL